MLDQATAPMRAELELVDGAWSTCPEWFSRPVIDDSVDQYVKRQMDEWDHADIILCGSSFVRNMLNDAGVPPHRTVIVPLAISMDSTQNQHRARRRRGDLRVVFAGDDGLRKGLFDFIVACRLAGLSRERVCVAGNLQLLPEGSAETDRRTTRLGRIGHSSLLTLFGDCDVIVLPSVSDTFGLVVLEAMSQGCVPVVSENTGAADVIEHGISGFVVPVHAPERIAECLDVLATSLSLLEDMKEQAIETARRCDIAAYGGRLREVVMEVAVRRTGQDRERLPLEDIASKASSAE